MTPRRVVTGEEQDVHTRWRKVLVWTHRAGAVRKVKQRTNRRERREGRAEAQAQRDETDRDT